MHSFNAGGSRGADLCGAGKLSCAALACLKSQVKWSGRGPPNRTLTQDHGTRLFGKFAAHVLHHLCTGSGSEHRHTEGR